MSTSLPYEAMLWRVQTQVGMHIERGGNSGYNEKLLEYEEGFLSDLQGLGNLEKRTTDVYRRLHFARDFNPYEIADAPTVLKLMDAFIEAVDPCLYKAIKEAVASGVDGRQWLLVMYRATRP